MKKLNVLSLFDGISCGRVALERAGFEIESYYASEIEESAIKVSNSNWDDIVQIGDIRNIEGNNYKDIDLIIGGSPCQNFSFAGSQNGAVTKDKIEVTNLSQYLDLKEKGFEFEGYSYLFWEYVRLLKEINPKYFLLENVKMTEKWKNVITDALGVKPILIDSELVSAQHRERNYWTNIPNVNQPVDKNIFVRDVITSQDEDMKKKKYCNDSNMKTLMRPFGSKAKILTIDTKKSNTLLRAMGGGGGNGVYIAEVLHNKDSINTYKIMNNEILINGVSYKTDLPNGEYGVRKLTVKECCRLQTLPDNYCDIVSNSEAYKAIGNGWTVDVIAHILRNIQ